MPRRWFLATLLGGSAALLTAMGPGARPSPRVGPRYVVHLTMASARLPAYTADAPPDACAIVAADLGIVTVRTAWTLLSF